MLLYTLHSRMVRRTAMAQPDCRQSLNRIHSDANVPIGILQMGGRVGILDADVHGPSLPTMISPQPRVMIMDPATRVRASRLVLPCRSSPVSAASNQGCVTRQCIPAPDTASALVHRTRRRCVFSPILLVKLL